MVTVFRSQLLVTVGFGAKATSAGDASLAINQLPTVPCALLAQGNILQMVASV
jgi:hypothetical protein